MLEKVMRSPQGKGDNKQIVMSEAHFLAGLIEDRSGSFIDSWCNHLLKLKKQKKIFYLNRLKQKWMLKMFMPVPPFASSK